MNSSQRAKWKYRPVFCVAAAMLGKLKWTNQSELLSCRIISGEINGWEITLCFRLRMQLFPCAVKVFGEALLEMNMDALRINSNAITQDERAFTVIDRNGFPLLTSKYLLTLTSKHMRSFNCMKKKKEIIIWSE